MGLNVRQHTAALQSILSDSISHFKEYCIISILYFHYEVKIEKKAAFLVTECVCCLWHWEKSSLITCDLGDVVKFR